MTEMDHEFVHFGSHYLAAHLQQMRARQDYSAEVLDACIQREIGTADRARFVANALLYDCVMNEFGDEVALRVIHAYGLRFTRRRKC